MKAPSKHLTIRNLPPELAKALQREKRRRGVSLNQTVLDLLTRSLGVAGGRRSNGLGQMAGTWTRAEHEAFEAAVAATEEIDEELWR